MDLARRVKGIKPSPTLDTPENVKAAAIKALNDGFTKYTPVPGTNDARDAIIGKLKRDQGLDYDRSQIIISCGAKHTLFNIAQALFQEGDEIIVPAPYWVSYPAQIILAGAEPVIVETREENGFTLTMDDLEKSSSNRTRALILNSPSNPTGAAYDRGKLEEIAAFAREKDILVISDEIYEKLVYDDFRFTSIAELPGMKERTVLVNGLSKAYAMTGWRIGYAAGPVDLVAAMTKIQSQSTSNPTSFALPATAEALNGPQDFVETMRVEFDKRRRYIVDRLNRMDSVTCFTPLGAFYAFPNFSGLYGRSFKGKEIRNSTDLADYLLDEAKVAIVPGIAFGADDCARLSYASSMENITKGLDRIEAAIAELD